MKVVYSIALCLFTFFSHAQEKALLWEISGKGLTKPSYLFGTIHLICPKDYFMTDSTKAAFDKAEQVYLELDMDDPTMMAKMMKTAMFSDGKKLKDYLKPEDITVLNDFLKQKTGMSLDMMNGMKPFTVMSMLYMSLLDCQPQSYEMNFTQMATKAKKEMLGLETVEFQMGVFDQIPYEKQAALLADMVRKKDASAKEFGELVALYKAQDVEGLFKAMDESEWDFNGYEDLLLSNRNAAWVPVMEKAMQTKPTFFAVGAGHLGGKKGVLNLLKKQGYAIKPVL
ncbi:MAG: TraB/GumN family protein [Spirosomataceae bacterium]